MSALRHPNIVQYLGMFRDTDTHLPVLLMELMDDSLTHFLESSTQPIPYHIQVDICHDIVLALSFLHANNIVHRDLSSNNVLLRGHVLAKVTDFGMARLGDINPRATRFINTKCPGTDVYMPPEAVQSNPVYTEKIDCFSFGVITIQTLTKQFPEPQDRLQEVSLTHPGLPAGTVLVRIPEINRRQNHISQVPPNHSLLPIALDCLKDKEGERPSAHQLCERVTVLKRMRKYIISVRTIQEKDEVIQSQATRLEENIHTISSKEEENQQLRQQLQKEIKEKEQANRQLEESNRQIKQMNQQLKQIRREKDQALKEKKQAIRQLEKGTKQLAGHVNQQGEHMVAQNGRQRMGSQGVQRSSKASSGGEPTGIKLRWRRGKRAPCTMNRWYDAVVSANTVYVMNQDTVNIYAYHVADDRWSELPDCIYVNCSLVITNGWLTTVGGGTTHPTFTNELLSFDENKTKAWTKKFPPMPTKRWWTTAIYTDREDVLIVAGGGLVGEVLSTVEVMDTENHQWFTADGLPQPMYCASATVCEDELFMLGGEDSHIYLKSVYTCSVRDLVRSCIGRSRRSYVSVWRQIADLPVTGSTSEYFNDQLLAIGGRIVSQSGNAATAIYMYNSATNSWEIISHMMTNRYNCFTAVPSDNQLVIVGGCNNSAHMPYTLTDTVQCAQLCD